MRVRIFGLTINEDRVQLLVRVLTNQPCRSLRTLVARDLALDQTEGDVSDESGTPRLVKPSKELS